MEISSLHYIEGTRLVQRIWRSVRPVADNVALSDDVTPWTEQDHGKMSEYMFMPLSKYTGACSSYTYISEELNRFKQQAADLGDAAASLQRENREF
ncbi:hypothetical protein Tco_1189032 [Tanacetum coccineum]